MNVTELDEAFEALRRAVNTLIANGKHETALAILCEAVYTAEAA